MKKMNMPSRALSCVLACALVFTMNPTTAFADEPAINSAETADESVVQEQLAEEPVNSTDAETADSDVEQFQVPAIHVAEVPVADTEEASEPGQPEMNASAASIEGAADLEIIAGSVALNQTPSTMLVHNGLNYQMNSDNPETVTLVGWSTAPAGHLTIPSRIQTSSGTFTVTGIVAGGGSLKI